MMKSRKKIVLIVALMVVLIIGWIIWGNTALMISEFTIKDEKIPGSFNGFRIAQISDLHNAEFGENNEKLIELLEKCEPDIILLTGDLVDSRNTDIEIGISFAEKAVMIAPTYYVTGNHEARISEYEEFIEGITSAGVRVLENESVMLEQSGESIIVAGVADPSFITDYLFGDTESVTKEILSEMNVDNETYTILLAHRPELFDVYVESNVDLVFSGHAHGGQFRLPFIGGVVAPNQGLFPVYDAGLYTKDTTSMIVSRGIGNSLFPFRVNNRPELVVAELSAE